MALRAVGQYEKEDERAHPPSVASGVGQGGKAARL